MSNSLGDLLAGKGKELSAPPEVRIIKTFVRENFETDCHVTVQQWQIIIGVRGASMASALRMRLHELQKLCNTNKRLVLRIQS